MHRMLLLVCVAALSAAVFVAGCPKPAPVDVAPSGEMGGAVPAEPTATGGGAAASTTIQAKGSDTLLQVAQAWAEEYKKAHPDVDVSVTGGGSGTGFKAILDGTTDIANASRAIKDEEKKACEDKGIILDEKIVGYDGIAVIVNKANPLQSISIDDLSDLYVGNTRDWSPLGGKGEVVLVSRDSTSGTYEYFKEHVVQKNGKDKDRDYAASALKVPSNEQIREQVAKTEGAIGYIGLGYLDDSVKVLGILDDKGEAVQPSVEGVKDGSYPISRPLSCYIKADAPQTVGDYMDWVLGPEGQAVVAREDFVPVK